ncbi:T9SS type B sorting domain-containing protein [Catalinimonas niigatensis]|uniref:T9SS type B sorting domain-containing protein n=1 Tax=Catalinimonas niigatensis TaxID=1397264 RepID=UPI0026670AE3|nr:gliding motility-associated C-terminal domain-containing protein [Catalinimonas niigatensis]WPP51146.1 gliding motility-associated C-terminal domain-containing protein [Catalinimonas niigatensis]
MKHTLPKLFVALFLLSISYSAKATHIRAGEIIAELINCQSYTYRFRVIGYEDTGSDVEFGNGEVYFGFGDPVDLSTENEFFVREVIDNEKLIRVSEFVIERTFPGPGEYTITFREFNRNADILNISNSVQTPFYVETKLIIDPFLACNNSPVLLNPPVDGAVIGKRFLHNPGAYDPDGDSLSYKFVLPKQDVEEPVDGYLYPDEYDQVAGLNQNPIKQDGSQPTEITLDPVTGELIWDSPANAGEYNVAFIVEEWRLIEGEWIRLGYVTRDMQILVEDADNEPPVVEIPADTCIVAGSELLAEITGTDPDGDQVVLTGFGGVFEQLSSPAQFFPDPPVPQASPATGTFSWQTDCSHVREKPYQINFRAADFDPATGPSLADFKIWNVTVVAPAPTGLVAEAAPGKAVNLTWDNYSCAAQAETIQIWRKTDSTSFEPANCQVGIPAGLGYELVAEVDANVVSFRDEGLNPGANYCYRLVAVFPQPEGGKSYASEEACAEMLADAPVITQVSVDATGMEDGAISIGWRSPFEIDQALFPPPYTYEVVRIDLQNPDTNGEVISPRISDTTFVDTGLNTQDQPYGYKIYLYDASEDLIDSSAVAFSVRLEPTPLVGSIELEWTADVPWSNNSPEYPYHYIYRNKVDANNESSFVLIDSVNVSDGNFSYLDNGSFNGSELSDEVEYCYYIVTQGSYGNDQINPPPLVNFSQIACAQPNDTIPPCTPLALSIPNGSLDNCESFLADKSCDFQNYENTLVWEDDFEASCDDDIRSYNIYFSASGEEGTFNIIGSSNEPRFVHGPLTSLAGCYRISAVDRSGNESGLSEPVCNDNCPYYELPNVFTPNGDGRNDTFRPMDGSDDDFGKCPRFVESVTLRVHNRWGKEVYTYESGNENSIYIDWDGRTENGDLLAAGVYYYVADVKFISLDPSKRQQTIKGWVNIVYGREQL